jgi:drug/metabolite transporter (DMT)-like permease
MPSALSSPASNTPRDHMARAILFMLASAAGFTLMGIAVRSAGELPLIQKVFMRNLVTVIIASVWVLRDHYHPLLSWQPHSWRLIVRSLSGLSGVACYFYALEHVTLADASMLNKLSPFFVFLFARWFLKEQLSRPLVVALLVAFSGALLVIKPRFDMSMMPALIGASSAIFAAIAYTIVRSLRGLEPPHRIVFWFSAISTIITLPLALKSWVSPADSQWIALVLIGIGASFGQFCLTYAYQLAPAAKISVVNYSSIVMALLAGWLLWGEWPDMWSMLGGGLIIIAALLTRIRRTSA